MMQFSNIQRLDEKRCLRMWLVSCLCYLIRIRPSITLYGEFECDFEARGPVTINLVSDRLSVARMSSEVKE